MTVRRCRLVRMRVRAQARNSPASSVDSKASGHSRFGLLILGILASFAFVHSAAALPFNDLIVFGDSLVDQGNLQDLATAGLPGTGPCSSNPFPCDPAPASLGYFDGRFTNGVTPADQLNQAIEGTNSEGYLTGGDNYAYGGARARDDTDGIPDLTFQVDTYLSVVSNSADAGSLYYISIGGNDIRDIVINGLTGAARQQVIDDAVASSVANVNELIAAGATNILFSGVGNVGGIPEVAALPDPGAPAAGLQASSDLNAALLAALPGSVIFYDPMPLYTAVFLDPAAFGLPAGINFTDPCLSAAAAPPGGAPTCNDYAFFDDVHITSQTLQLMGNELLVIVPEPGTALLLMMGLTCLAARQRNG